MALAIGTGVGEGGSFGFLGGGRDGEGGAAMEFCVCIFLKSDRSVNLTTMMMLMTRNDESDVM